MKIRIFAWFLVALAFCQVAGAADAANAPASGSVLRIGIHEKPPYATKNASGEWDGLAVELWKNIVARTGLRFEFVELRFEQILPAIAEGRIDAAVGEMTVTAEWEKSVRFTQPYLISSGGAALPPKIWHTNWRQIAGVFFSWTLVLVLLAILAGMFLVSVLIWALERHHRVGHFRGGLKGFGSALWFSASTVTGVGYGDAVPASFVGRLISFIWMLAGVLLVAGFTATVASSMSAATIGDLNGKRVKELADLRHYSCGVMTGSLAHQILVQDGLNYTEFETFEEAFKAMADGKIETVVGDKLCLRYFAKRWAQKTPPHHFSVSSVTNENIFIGIPVRPGLAEYHDINLALLQTVSTESWQGAIRRWLSDRAD